MIWNQPQGLNNMFSFPNKKLHIFFMKSLHDKYKCTLHTGKHEQNLRIVVIERLLHHWTSGLALTNVICKNVVPTLLSGLVRAETSITSVICIIDLTVAYVTADQKVSGWISVHSWAWSLPDRVGWWYDDMTLITRH